MYLDFLEGHSFDKKLLSINYNDVVINMSDYVVYYYVQFKNGSYSYNLFSNSSKEVFASSYTGFWNGFFYNCYALNVPHNMQIKAHYVTLKSNIFPNSTRAQNIGMVALLHYPGQLLLSEKTIKYSWPSRERYDSFMMRFIIKGVEVLKRRNKGSRPCLEDWENYDNNVQMEHINNVGCRSPYQNSSTTIPLCNNKDKISKSQLNLNWDPLVRPLPCKTMEKIYYTYEEGNIRGQKWHIEDHFSVAVYNYDQKFKEVVQKR